MVVGTLSRNASRSIVSCIAWLGLLRTGVDLWHFEFFPASLLLVGWNILDMCGNPPNVATGVFDAPIPLTGWQRYHRKNRNSAGVESALIRRHNRLHTNKLHCA